MRGHRLPSLPTVLLEFTYVFRLFFSIRKVASEHLFCVLRYLNSYIFHIYFILFIFLSNTHLILDFICLMLPLADTHGIHTYIRRYTDTQKKPKCGKVKRKNRGAGSSVFSYRTHLVQRTSNIGFYLLDVTIGRHTWNCQIRTHIHTKVHRHTKKTKMWKSKKETKRVFFFAGSSMFSYSLYLKCASSICRFSVMYRTEIPAPAVNGRQRVQGLHLCQECWCFTNFQYSKGTRAALEMMTNVDLNQHIQNCQ